MQTQATHPLVSSCTAHGLSAWGLGSANHSIHGSANAPPRQQKDFARSYSATTGLWCERLTNDTVQRARQLHADLLLRNLWQHLDDAIHDRDRALVNLMGQNRARSLLA